MDRFSCGIRHALSFLDTATVSPAVILVLYSIEDGKYLDRKRDVQLRCLQVQWKLQANDGFLPSQQGGSGTRFSFLLYRLTPSHKNRNMLPINQVVMHDLTIPRPSRVSFSWAALEAPSPPEKNSSYLFLTCCRCLRH